MPADAVYVGRPTRWGNPFAPGKPATDPATGDTIEVRDRAHAVALYRAWLPNKLINDAEFLHPLRGKNLVCWCPLDGPCHADLLLDFTNAAEIRR